MSSWIESQYDLRLTPNYLQPPDHTQADGSIPGADHHSSSMHTGYSYASRYSPISSRQAYSAGLYGPRPQPAPPDTMQTFPTPPVQVPVPGMTETEEADDEYMEVEPGANSAPAFESEYDDEPRSQGRLRFVGGFMRTLRKIPRAMKRGLSLDRQETQSPPGLAYQQTPYQSPYMPASQPQESEEAPPYDAPAEHIDADLRYVEGMNMHTEPMPPNSPSRTPSHTIRAPRSESQLTYQSLTNPSSRHLSQHGSLHHAHRSSPPRTVRNPDPVSPTEESNTTNGSSQRAPSQHTPEPGPEPGPRTSRVSLLDPIRRPTVTIQSPTDSAVYVEPQHADDYVGMDAPVDPPPEPTIPSQFARIRKFFRDLNDLPWVSPNVTVDFDPADSKRARSGGSGRSWYTGRLHDLDLLDGGGSSTRGLTAPSGHSLGPAPGSSATLAPRHGSGSASSSEGASAHLPAAHALHSHLCPIPQLALSPQPLYLYPAAYHAMPPPPPSAPLPPSPSRQPNGTEQVSPQPSGQSDVPRPPYLYVVAIPPGYLPSPVDPSRPIQMQPAYLPPYPPPV
ncbi:hypothetical protein BJV78DRAFT_1249740 [Lactifluus subvellereus]|nr:hypothetical protein BJV78DRAFT_1249740 [Lactifluus subvellereus]